MGDDKLEKTEEIIKKWAKEIAEKESYANIKIKFCSLYISSKKSVRGNCNVEKNKINFNRVLIPLCVFYFENYKEEIWEIILHEIAHLKKLEDSNKLTFYKSSDLKEGEYIDWHHHISFWKYLRKLREKYDKDKEQFYKELQDVIAS
ncbi:MAG TPA: hypothetical protein P5277_00705 [Candidatus Paceibacterota bacterium]|nr:hypothetical protein [Candidatus Paceibacterota bacterium]